MSYTQTARALRVLAEREIIQCVYPHVFLAERGSCPAQWCLLASYAAAHFSQHYEAVLTAMHDAEEQLDYERDAGLILAERWPGSE